MRRSRRAELADVVPVAQKVGVARAADVVVAAQAVVVVAGALVARAQVARA